MSDEHELYAAVVADPNDEAPRRALAAYYDGCGDPRGELIRLQLEIAAKDAKGILDGGLIGRERALIRAHGRTWAAPLADLIAGAEAMRTLRWLALGGNKIGRPGGEALAASPWLANLPVLDLMKNPCDPTPRPGGRDLDDRVTAIDRPMVANELEARYGRRPWLDNPEDPDAWPLPRDSYRLIH
jgi:uncharacterized protein (TIGR02996 family)